MKPKSHSCSQRSSEGLRSLFSSLATMILLLTCCSTFAGGIVTNCTETSLRAALAGGGTVTFACDGTIVLSNTLVIASDTVIDASGRSVTLDGNSTNRVLTILTNVSCLITNVRVVRGYDLVAGGGIHNSGTLTLQSCVVSNNLVGGFLAGSRKGAGIMNLGVCNLYGCTLVSNLAPASEGGAIYNDNGSVLRAVGSTFYNNLGGQAGGAIYNTFSGRVGATNCTFVGNSAGTGPEIYHQSTSGPLVIKIALLNCTFGSIGSGIQGYPSYPTIWVANSIVPGCNACADGGNNITNSLSFDPRLAPLADNGGPTPTMALLPDSPAINQANNALAPGTDQRGVVRPFGSTADIGAYEAAYAPAPAVVQFGSASQTVSEGATNVIVNVVRLGNSGPTFTVNYATGNGSAVAGSDYVATNGTLAFGFGQTNATILIPLINDSVPESMESLTVSLSNVSSGASLGGVSVSQVSIQDDDPVRPGAFRLQFGSYRVSESGSPLVVNVLRVGGTNGPVAVNFSTTSGTAQAGLDFVATNGTLTFADTETIKSFAVQLLRDAINEGGEDFVIALSNPGGGASLTNPAVGNVNINDGVQTLTSCDEPGLRAAVAAGGKVILSCDGVIPLTSPLVISNGVVIEAIGHQVTLSGRGSNRIFSVNSGVTLELIHLTLADGLAARQNGVSGSAGGLGAGGAVYLDGGILTASDCSFVRNRAIGGSDGVGGPASGGAVHSLNGQVFLNRCVVSLNYSQGGNAGSGSGFETGGNASGGALYCDGGTAWIADSLFSTNGVQGGLGTRQGFVGPGQSGAARGGALANNGGIVSLTGTALSGNFSSNWTEYSFNLNTRGGGIDQSSGIMSLRDCLVEGNWVQGGTGGSGGGGYFPSGPAWGGGIFFGGGALGITNSTFTANSALGGRATSGTPQKPGPAFGGGIYSTGSISLVNCTLASNLARSGVGRSVSVRSGGYGGGLHHSGGLAELSHVTFAGNSVIGSDSGAPQQGGAIFTSSGVTRLANTLLANSPSGSNAFGTLIDGGGNLSSDASCNFTSPGSLNNVNPLLGPLADYGGPVPTMALLAGSPAIDAGLPANCVATDQRGVARPFGASCDIGAFESASPYTILGRITGYVPPAGTAAVGSGGLSANADAAGQYALHGLTPGTHTLKPASSNAVFLPKTRLVNVVADTLDIDFPSYRTNALVIERMDAGHLRNTFAGEALANYSVEVSTVLSNWGFHRAITTDAEGLVSWTETNSPAPSGRFFRARRP